MGPASIVAAATVVSDPIQRNGKTYLAVKAVDMAFEMRNHFIDLYSKSLNPIINHVINEAINTKSFGLYKHLQVEIEEYASDVVKSIISPIITHKMAIQDFFQH